jgi:hypothetical protein
MYLQRRAAAAQEFAYFMGQAVKLPELPLGVAMAGGLAIFEVYGWFVVGEIIGKRQLIGDRFLKKNAPVHVPPHKGGG